MRIVVHIRVVPSLFTQVDITVGTGREANSLIVIRLLDGGVNVDFTDEVRDIPCP